MCKNNYFNTYNQINDFFPTKEYLDRWNKIVAPIPFYEITSSCDYEPKKPATSIKNVMFRPPATIVFWSDGTKTAVVDEFMKDCKSYKIKEKDNRIVYVNSKGQKRSVNYKKWKEDGLTNALLKKMMPKYFKVLRKWC